MPQPFVRDVGIFETQPLESNSAIKYPRPMSLRPSFESE